MDFALGSSFVSVALSFLASYALARIRFPGSSIVFMIFIVSIAVPAIGTVVPLFEMLKWLDLVNDRGAMIMLMASLIVPFTVWIMVPFIQQIPAEIEEAAVIDGANLFQVLRHVVSPLIIADGTPDQVKAETRRVLEKLAPCGGLILQDGNNIAPGSPIENINAMMEAAAEYARSDPKGLGDL